MWKLTPKERNVEHLTQAILVGMEEFADKYTGVEFNLFRDERLWLAECISQRVLDCLQSPVDAVIKAVRPPGSPTYTEPVVVFGVVNDGGEWHPFQPYCLFPDGKV